MISFITMIIAVGSKPDKGFCVDHLDRDDYKAFAIIGVLITLDMCIVGGLVWALK